ncbi:hypothetical protein PSHT_01665 [Puccinia striiformis]|uniref:Uncharacterized protein n=3 Tax=Puccinia striiformis TaxID=27350 RepID=A0A2S4WK12_9BASI|nr:hypothetical protein PSTT_02298 [Puccinia striiformis]POW22125.1 hypothetical protein PSHT_01665 [Puccinia striiformis]
MTWLSVFLFSGSSGALFCYLRLRYLSRLSLPLLVPPCSSFALVPAENTEHIITCMHSKSFPSPSYSSLTSSVSNATPDNHITDRWNRLLVAKDKQSLNGNPRYLEVDRLQIGCPTDTDVQARMTSRAAPTGTQST